MLVETLLKWLGMLWDVIAPAMPAMLTSFFSVLVGAMPFMVIAAFGSAILEVFVSKDAIARLVPRRGFLGVLLAPLVGLVVPMCECGIVPVARRMVQKGVPGAAAVTFMLSNPVINPLSIYSTYLAFPGFRAMVVWRILLTYIAAVIIGMVVYFLMKGKENEAMLNERFSLPVAATAEGAHGHDHGHGPALSCDCGHDHGEHSHEGQSFGQKFQAMLDHAATEFFDVSKYFIIGSALAAISQALIDRPVLESIGGGVVTSVLVMIAFAFVLCICSEADAFVAANFASTFTPGALLAFLVAGPMTDIKNTLMMQGAFRRRFVWLLNTLIIGLTAALTITLNLYPEIMDAVNELIRAVGGW